MDSPPNLPHNIQSILHEILRSQQTCLQTMSECAHTPSTLSATWASPDITHFSTNTLPWVSHNSFNQPPPVYHLTNQQHPSPYHQPIPHLAFPSFNNHPPLMTFSVTPNFFVLDNDERSHDLVVIAVKDQAAPHQDLSLSNSIALSNHDHDQNPIHHPELSLNIDSVSIPLFFQPIEKDEEEITQSHELVADASDFSTVADLVVEEHKAIFTEVFKDHDSPNLVLDHSEVVSSSSKTQNGTIIAQLPFDAVRISGSKLYFDFVFLVSDLLRSSCLELRPFAWATTMPSPAKTNGNTTLATNPRRSPFVFDPGGTPTATVRRNHPEFQKTVAFTVAVATPPPQRSTFVFDPGRNSTIPVCRTHHEFQKLHSHPVLFAFSLHLASSSTARGRRCTLLGDSHGSSVFQHHHCELFCAGQSFGPWIRVEAFCCLGFKFFLWGEPIFSSLERFSIWTWTSTIIVFRLNFGLQHNIEFKTP